MAQFIKKYKSTIWVLQFANLGMKMCPIKKSISRLSFTKENLKKKQVYFTHGE